MWGILSQFDAGRYEEVQTYHLTLIFRN